jgi:hypothetical protein
MDQTTSSGLPASLVNGRLEGLSVPDLLWNLCRSRSTGVLHVTSRGITKKVYIDEGRIVFAGSGDPDDRLGDLLLREGLISLDQLEAAIARLSGGKRLGTLLVDGGHLSPENLVRAVLNQVRGIVLALFPMDEGEYAFAEGPLPTEEVITLGMRTAEILLQGIRQIRSFSRIRKSVGPPSSRFRLDPSWHEVLDGLDIRDGERMLLQRLDAAGTRGAPVDALCREVFLSNFEIYQALWAFLVLGVVKEVDRGGESSPGAAIEGRLERTHLPEILVRICREQVTGVLHMARGTIERTLHIKQGSCIFATSNAVDDGLVAHLLRRGVISLSDREETARRMLSNKRVGTILLEMGVIDEGDLRATVREQLSEIVFDTFRWDRGDFQFLAGELPTIEEITLTRSLEDLIFAGVRRVTSWSRVRDGCGGLGARLVLQPEYLSVLDNMTIGPEEWELISLLKAPKTVVQICRESMLGDFRSCQILWALRLLGAIGEAPLDISIDSALGIMDAHAAPEPAPALAEATEPASIPLSEADTTAEVISELWRVEAMRPEGDASVAMPPAEAPPPESEAAAPPIPVSAADAQAEVISEPWRVEAMRPEGDASVAMPPAEAPPPESEAAAPPIPVSAADAQAEVISEPWQLATEPPAEDVPEPPSIAFEIDTPADATVAIPREDVEAALSGSGQALPRFELGEPGTGLEDMKVDIRAAEQPAAEEEAPGVPVSHEEIAPELATSEPSEQPPASEALDPDRTVRISREEIESSLRASVPEPEPEPEPEPMVVSEAPAFDAPVPDAPVLDAPAFAPSPDLDGAIASFNARHVVLFRALRAEIGAGAANFVRSCRGALENGYAELFATADLRSDGSWDPEALKRSVIDNRIADASEGFQRLLEGEMQRLRVQLSDARAAALADQLASIP